MSSALVFIFVLGVLVIIHELGHLLAARSVGVRVESFSVGFGPVIFGKKFGETEFCVSLLPLGGFVKLAGESPEESRGSEWEFNSKSLLQKFWIVCAGPLMNALLAFVLFSCIFVVGQPTLSATIGKVMPDTAAQAAGLSEGDRIRSINGKAVTYWEDILGIIHGSQGADLAFTVERGGAPVVLMVHPKVQELKDIFGRTRRASFVGISPSQDMVYVKSGVIEAIGLGAGRVWTLTGMILTSLGLMFTGGISFKESVTGPIGIFFMTKQAAALGAVYLFYFMGSLSVSLFVLNLLPVPALDGGHLLFILIEKIKGSPLKDSVKEKMTQGGMVVLLGLMAFVILQDVHRFSILDHIRKIFIK